MVRKDLLIHKTQRLLDEFLAPMLEHVDKPRQRFLRQTVRAILFSGSLVVMELCKWIRDKCSDPFYQDKRLLNHLVSPQAGLERFRVRPYVAIQRLALLAMLAMGFLTQILLRSRDLTQRLSSFTNRFRMVRFQYCRLLDGIQEFMRLRPTKQFERNLWNVIILNEPVQKTMSW
jgi:hypothetical protein